MKRKKLILRLFMVYISEKFTRVFKIKICLFNYVIFSYGSKQFLDVLLFKFYFISLKVVQKFIVTIDI